MSDLIYAMTLGNDHEAAYFIPQEFFELGELCSTCGLNKTIRKRAISLAYQGGIPQAFATAGIREIFATEETAKTLASKFACLSIEEAYILKSKWAGPYAENKTRDARKYDGPRYVEIRLALDLPIDLNRSTVDLWDYCSECGSSGLFKIIGAEKPPHELLVGDRWEMQPRTARNPLQGVFVSASELGDCKVFSYGGKYNLCTEEVRAFIVKQGYRNIGFLEVGTVLD